MLTAAQLAGLQFDAPADQLAATTTTFTYSVSDGSATVNAGTTINVTPVNGAVTAISRTSINIALVNDALGRRRRSDGDLAVPAQGTVSVNMAPELLPANNFSAARC